MGTWLHVEDVTEAKFYINNDNKTNKGGRKQGEPSLCKRTGIEPVSPPSPAGHPRTFFPEDLDEANQVYTYRYAVVIVEESPIR